MSCYLLDCIADYFAKWPVGSLSCLVGQVADYLFLDDWIRTYIYGLYK